MQIKAKLKYLRISPRKVRLVANMIKGMDVREARVQLEFLTKRAAKPLLKLLNSAISNAENNFGLDKKNLYIAQVLINEGPTFKRWMPRAFGRAYPINKRTSHIEMVLEEKEVTKKIQKKVRVKKKAEEKKIEEPKEVREKEKPTKPAKKTYQIPERRTVAKKPSWLERGRRMFRRKSL